MERKNCREMSDEELKAWKRKLDDSSSVKDLTEAHRRVLRVVQNPIRIEILTILKGKSDNHTRNSSPPKMDEKTLGFHT